jgi:hypothetical protein
VSVAPDAGTPPFDVLASLGPTRWSAATDPETGGSPAHARAMLAVSTARSMPTPSSATIDVGPARGAFRQEQAATWWAEPLLAVRVGHA